MSVAAIQFLGLASCWKCGAIPLTVGHATVREETEYLIQHSCLSFAFGLLLPVMCSSVFCCCVDQTSHRLSPMWSPFHCICKSKMSRQSVFQKAFKVHTDAFWWCLHAITARWPGLIVRCHWGGALSDAVGQLILHAVWAWWCRTGAAWMSHKAHGLDHWGG